MAVDYKGAVDEGIQASKLTYDALNSIAQDHGVPPFIAQAVAFLMASLVAIGRVLYIIVLFAFVSIGTSLITACLQVIKQIRQDGAAAFAEVTGEALGEFMAIDTKSVDFAVGKEPADALKRATQLGDLFVSMMQQQFGEGGVQSPQAGEAAAKALAGYGINFATTNQFLSMIVELGTEGKLGDFDKLGEDIASTVGLGRLTRRALTPLVRNAVSHPYDRAMRAKFRPDLLAPPQLIKAWLAGELSEELCDQYIAEHGFQDDFIGILKAQHTPGLTAAEIEHLRAMGAIDLGTAAGMIKADGVPDSIIQWRMQLLTYKRLEALRHRILGEVLSQINSGLAPASDMDKWTQSLNIPSDETDLWRVAAGIASERTRKRLSESEMLFLYEAAQITDLEVEEWARAQGYAPDDVAKVVDIFRLKAIAAAQSKPSASAANAAHLHNEHVAYVTDEITGLFGRAPTPAELTFWVAKLDTKERTKHDFVTEIKALDSAGSAIPPA